VRWHGDLEHTTHFVAAHVGASQEELMSPPSDLSSASPSWPLSAFARRAWTLLATADR
jgi:hypothetical protein